MPPRNGGSPIGRFSRRLVYPPVASGALSESVVDARWALTCTMLDGENNVKARLVAEGYQDADLEVVLLTPRDV